MRSDKLVPRLLRDNAGSVLVETAIVLVLFFLLALGTVDATYMFFEWAMANKAAHVGARTAVVSNPVDPSVYSNLSFSPSQLQKFGDACYDSSGDNVNCPAMNSVCTSTGCSVCNSNGCVGSRYDANSFNTILTAMKQVFPRLAAQNVRISYETNGTGFVGEPYFDNTTCNGCFILPMNVTVSIQCMTHQFFFIDALMGWIFSPPANCPTSPKGAPIPAVATTRQSEDMFTN
jgi:Flp pilus assembly protein TadG